MKNENILILLLSSHKYPSPRNELMQQKTWIKEAEKNNIRVINFIGGFKETRYNHPYLELTSDDSIEAVGYKTLDAFGWAMENSNFKYLFRVNSSSYVEIDRLIKFTESITSNSLYCGNVTKLKMLDLNFISGSGILLSRDTINEMMINKEKWDHNIIDDVAMGKLCKDINIKPSKGDFYEIKKNILFDNELKNSYHYRCKLEDYGYPRYLESLNIYFLHKLLTNNRINPLIKFLSVILFYVLKFLNIQHFLNKYIFRNRHLRNRLRKYKDAILENF